MAVPFGILPLNNFFPGLAIVFCALGQLHKDGFFILIAFFWILRNCTQIRPCGGAVGRLYFSNVFVGSCASLETFVVFDALRCRRGFEGGFLETVRKFDHVVALWFACVFPLFSWTLAFHSGRSSLLTPCDAVVVSRVDSSKLCAISTMWWR